MMMLLLIGPLQKLKVLVGSPRSISDRMLRDTIQDLCINNRSSSLSSSRIIADDNGNDHDNDDSGIIDSSSSSSLSILTLRPESYHLFDPEFIYLSSDQLSKACDKMRDYLRNYDQHHYNHNNSNNNLTNSISSDSINNNNNIEYHYKPLISLQALPIPHNNFQTIRLFLYQPLLFKLLHSSLFLSTSPKDSIIKSLPISSNSNMISRVLHLITLQIQCLHYYNNNNKNIINRNNTSNNNINSNDGNYYTTSRILFYEKAFSEPNFATNRPGDSSNHLSVSLHDLIITGCCRDILIILCKIYQSGSISKQDDIIYYHGLNWVLQQIFNYSIDGRQVISQYGISFPLFTSSNSNRSIVDGVDIKDDSVVDKKMDIITTITTTTATTTTTNSSTTTASFTNQELNSKMMRQMQARQRATIEAQKAAAAALQAFACEFSDSDDDDDENNNISNNNEKEKKGNDSSLDEKTDINYDHNYHDVHNNIDKKHKKNNDNLPVCIICKENKENILPLGYLCYVQPSNIIKNILLHNQDYSSELHQIYRVISSTGCPIYNIPNDDHNDTEIITIVPYNIHIKVEKVEGKWFRLIAPYSYGYCCLYSTVAHEKSSNSNNSGSFSSNSIQNENDNILNAYETILPTNTTNTTTTTNTNSFLRTTNKNKTTNNKNVNYKLRIYLYPVIDLQFNKYGGTKLNIHYCGHVMHNECWDTFYASNISKVEHGNRSANLLSIDIHKGESLCPLCKSVTNTLLPYTSSLLSSSLQPSSQLSLAETAININLIDWFSTLTVITDISTKIILQSLLQNQTCINLSKNKDNDEDDDDDDDDGSNKTVMETMKMMIDDNNNNRANHNNSSRSSLKVNVNVVNDNQFYDTLLQQQLLSWHSNNDDNNNNNDDDNDNSSHDQNINRYLGYDVRHVNNNDNDYDKLIPNFSYLSSFRSIHILWSTLSYTLLCQVIKKYRQNHLYGVSLTTIATSSSSGSSSSSSSCLSGLDSSYEIILQQSIYLLRRVPLRLSNSAIHNGNCISSIYDSFISKPLFELIFGVEDNYSIYQQGNKEHSHNNDNSSQNHNNDYKNDYNLRKNHDPTTNTNNMDDDNNEFVDTNNNALFLNVNNYNKNDIYHTLLSLPFDIIHTIPYPNQQIINHTMYLASKVDIPSCDLWPILKIPLLMQDLYMIHMSIVT
jgi:hypothetical protein